MSTTARLLQDFTGSYHVIAPDGRTVAFSLTLTQALAFCRRHGWTVA